MLINIYNDEDFDNIIVKIVNSYENHLSILAIKNHVNDTHTFSIQKISEIDIIISLNPSKNVNSVIPSKILKLNSDMCKKYFYNIFNNSLNDNIFPMKVKLADITPTHKNDDANDKKELQTTKIFDKIIHCQICDYINDTLSDKLCRFRKGYGPQYALLPIIEKFKITLDGKGTCEALLTDLCKAFDVLSHNLHAYGFDKNSLKYILSYLKGRLQRK